MDRLSVRAVRDHQSDKACKPKLRLTAEYKSLNNRGVRAVEDDDTDDSVMPGEKLTDELLGTKRGTDAAAIASGKLVAWSRG